MTRISSITVPCPVHRDISCILTASSNCRASITTGASTGNARLQAYYTTADGWSGAFTGEELGILFRRIAAHWKKGFELLKPLPGNRDTREQATVAEAVMIITQSTANVYDFYRLRGQRQTSADLRRLMEIVRAEQDCASRMLELVKEHPGIGFQAELQYYNLSPALLHSKINNTEEVLNILKRLINENRRLS